MKLDALSVSEAGAALERCCGAYRWVEGMLAARPYRSVDALHATADAVFDELGRADWLEAFRHHPKIGDRAALRKKFATTAGWASGEQSGAAEAAEEVLAALETGNAAYEARFGYIFIVCATGKSATEMLALLRARLPNDPDVELAIAAAEQRKITHLRLDKLHQELA